MATVVSSDRSEQSWPIECVRDLCRDLGRGELIDIVTGDDASFVICRLRRLAPAAGTARSVGARASSAFSLASGLRSRRRFRFWTAIASEAEARSQLRR
jgi:hypothetical protein